MFAEIGSKTLELSIPMIELSSVPWWGWLTSYVAGAMLISLRPVRAHVKAGLERRKIGQEPAKEMPLELRAVGGWLTSSAWLPFWMVWQLLAYPNNAAKK